MPLRDESFERENAPSRRFAQPVDQALPAEFIATLAEIVRRERRAASPILPIARH